MSDNTPEENNTTQSGSSENELSALDKEIDKMLADIGVEPNIPSKVELNAEQKDMLKSLDNLSAPLDF